MLQRKLFCALLKAFAKIGLHTEYADRDIFRLHLATMCYFTSNPMRQLSQSCNFVFKSNNFLFKKVFSLFTYVLVHKKNVTVVVTKNVNAMKAGTSCVTFYVKVAHKDTWVNIKMIYILLFH
jgi:hypothetical protein